MGVLGKLLDREKPEIFQAEEFQPCVCGNFFQWLDSYGNWHCHDCEPPRVRASVKAERGERSQTNEYDAERLGGQLDREGAADEAVAAVVGGMRVLAVASPLWPMATDEIAFDPETTQAERKQIIEDFLWCDRVAEREKKKQEIESP